MVEFLFAAEQLACQSRQIVDLPAMQAAALDLEEGGRLGDPSLVFPCWQMRDLENINLFSIILHFVKNAKLESLFFLNLVKG